MNRDVFWRAGAREHLERRKLTLEIVILMKTLRYIDDDERRKIEAHERERTRLSWYKASIILTAGVAIGVGLANAFLR